MTINSTQLSRFRPDGLLGEGADLQVFAATDAETGQPVVIKRPHPTLVSRRQHRGVEQRVVQSLEIREQLGYALPHAARLFGYTPPENHDKFFGDALGESYTVFVEERARGLPLVGSALDGIRRRPIGLPQNLFSLHPVVSHAQKGFSSIVRNVLDTAEAFHDAGVLLLDLRPQNVYFDPMKAAITVIDLCGVTEERPATNRHAALDWHDFYAEMFKWYVTPHAPPSNFTGYTQPYGMDSVTNFAGDLESMILSFSSSADDPHKSSARDMLRRIRERDYANFQEFRQEFEAYLSLVEERYKGFSDVASIVEPWNEARDLLADTYWSKFLFNSEQDLAPYDGVWTTGG